MKTAPRFIPSMNFIWKRAVGGYHWIDSKQGRRLCPVDALTSDWYSSSERYLREYRPLDEHSGLFWVFAALDANEEAIRQFANRFGLLGVAQEGQSSARMDALQAQPEPLYLWKREIEALQPAVFLWRAVAVGDRKLLGKLKHEFASHDAPLAFQRRLHMDSKDPAMFSLGAIQRLADPRLSEHVQTRFLFAGNAPRLKVVLQPQSLLGALWLQFAAAVDANKKYAKCPQCGEPFEVSRDTSGKRRSARFCSHRCRVAHYRERIDRARQLKGDGMPLRQIARALNTTVATVRNWLDSDRPSAAE